jgi:hypothetical protein
MSRHFFGIATLLGLSCWAGQAHAAAQCSFEDRGTGYQSPSCTFNVAMNQGDWAAFRIYVYDINTADVTGATLGGAPCAIEDVKANGSDGMQVTGACEAAASGMPTLTVNFSKVEQYSNLTADDVGQTGGVDVHAEAVGSSGNANSGSVTTTGADIVWGGARDGIAGGLVAGSGFAMGAATSDDQALDETTARATAGSVAASFNNNSGNWYAGIIAFAPASSGGGAHTSRSACNDPVPAIAATYGLTYEAFCPDMTNPAIYDLSDSLEPGFTWYIRRDWPYGRDWAGCCTAYDPTPPSQFTINSSGLTIGATDDWDGGGEFYTCAAANNSAGYVGTTFSGSFYVDVAYTSSGASDGNSAVWMDSINNLTANLNGNAASTVRWIELDNFETEYGRTVWDIQYAGSTEDFQDDYQIPINDNGVNGTLVVAPSLNGGTGLIERANNDVAFDTLEYRPTMVPVAAGAPLNYLAGTFSEINQDHFCILMGSDPGRTMTVSKVQVWTLPPGN